jgi:hypothetical protein
LHVPALAEQKSHSRIYQARKEIARNESIHHPEHPNNQSAITVMTQNTTDFNPVVISTASGAFYLLRKKMKLSVMMVWCVCCEKASGQSGSETVQKVRLYPYSKNSWEKGFSRM